MPQKSTSSLSLGAVSSSPEVFELKVERESPEEDCGVSVRGDWTVQFVHPEGAIARQNGMAIKEGRGDIAVLRPGDRILQANGHKPTNESINGFTQAKVARSPTKIDGVVLTTQKGQNIGIRCQKGDNLGRVNVFNIVPGSPVDEWNKQCYLYGGTLDGKGRWHSEADKCIWPGFELVRVNKVMEPNADKLITEAGSTKGGKIALTVRRGMPLYESEDPHAPADSLSATAASTKIDLSLDVNKCPCKKLGVEVSMSQSNNAPSLHVTKIEKGGLLERYNELETLSGRVSKAVKMGFQILQANGETSPERMMELMQSNPPIVKLQVQPRDVPTLEKAGTGLSGISDPPSQIVNGGPSEQAAFNASDILTPIEVLMVRHMVFSGQSGVEVGDASGSGGVAALKQIFPELLTNEEVAAITQLVAGNALNNSRNDLLSCMLKIGQKELEDAKKIAQLLDTEYQIGMILGSMNEQVKKSKVELMTRSKDMLDQMKKTLDKGKPDPGVWTTGDLIALTSLSGTVCAHLKGFLLGSPAIEEALNEAERSFAQLYAEASEIEGVFGATHPLSHVPSGRWLQSVLLDVVWRLDGELRDVVFREMPNLVYDLEQEMEAEAKNLGPSISEAGTPGFHKYPTKDSLASPQTPASRAASNASGSANARSGVRMKQEALGKERMSLLMQLEVLQCCLLCSVKLLEDFSKRCASKSQEGSLKVFKVTAEKVRVALTDSLRTLQVPFLEHLKGWDAAVEADIADLGNQARRTRYILKQLGSAADKVSLRFGEIAQSTLDLVDKQEAMEKEVFGKGNWKPDAGSKAWLALGGTWKDDRAIDKVSWQLQAASARRVVAEISSGTMAYTHMGCLVLTEVRFLYDKLQEMAEPILARIRDALDEEQSSGLKQSLDKLVQSNDKAVRNDVERKITEQVQAVLAVHESVIGMIDLSGTYWFLLEKLLCEVLDSYSETSKEDVAFFEKVLSDIDKECHSKIGLSVSDLTGGADVCEVSSLWNQRSHSTKQLSARLAPNGEALAMTPRPKSAASTPSGKKQKGNPQPLPQGDAVDLLAVAMEKHHTGGSSGALNSFGMSDSASSSYAGLSPSATVRRMSRTGRHPELDTGGSARAMANTGQHPALDNSAAAQNGGGSWFGSMFGFGSAKSTAASNNGTVSGYPGSSPMSSGKRVSFATEPLPSGPGGPASGGVGFASSRGIAQPRGLSQD